MGIAKDSWSVTQKYIQNMLEDMEVITANIEKFDYYHGSDDFADIATEYCTKSTPAVIKLQRDIKKLKQVILYGIPASEKVTPGKKI